MKPSAFFGVLTVVCFLCNLEPLALLCFLLLALISRAIE